MFEGYSNEETFAVAVVLENDSKLYKHMETSTQKNFIGESKHQLIDHAKKMEHPFFQQIALHAIEKVNLKEIHQQFKKYLETEKSLQYERTNAKS